MACQFKMYVLENFNALTFQADNGKYLGRVLYGDSAYSEDNIITFKRINLTLTAFLNSSTGSNMPHLPPVGQSLLVKSLSGLITAATG